MNLKDLFKKNGKNTAIIMGESRWDYNSLLDEISLYLSYLRSKGIKKGDFVACHGVTDLDIIFLFWASCLNGSILVPLNHNQPISYYKQFIEEMHMYLLDEDISIDRSGSVEKGGGISWEISLEQRVILLFTSGSTGKPKGILHTFNNLFYSSEGTIQFYGIGASDSWLLTLPLFHIGGLMIPFRIFMAGGTLILKDKEQSDSDVLQNLLPTFLSLVPAQLYRYINMDGVVASLQHCRYILLGGAACSISLLDKARELVIPISITYGSTESCSQLTACGITKGGYSVGHALLHREVKIIDGILYFRGKTLFKEFYQDGIWKKPSLDNGWYKTQDLAEQNGKGELFIKGRYDRTIVSGGENISLSEVEKSLRNISHPGVFQALSIDDKVYGELLVLIVWSLEKPPIKTILQTLSKKFSRLKMPRHIFWGNESNLKGIKPSLGESKRFLDLWFQNNDESVICSIYNYK